MRLRGGAPSGIWDSFNRSKAAGPHGLHETRAQPFNKLLIRTHRCSEDEGLRLAVSCEGDGVTAVGTWFASPDATHDDLQKNVSVELEMDPPVPGEASIWRATTKLPPGLLTYRYVVRRGEGAEEEDVLRRADIHAKPQQQSIMVATDLDGTLLGDVEKTDAFFRVWNEEYKPNRSALVFNTGRPLDSALGLVERGELQRPTALICSEGTQIFWISENGNLTAVPDEEWRYNLNETWCWPQLKEAVTDTLAPHRANVTKFLPLADMDCLQPMIVIAIKSHEAAAQVLEALEALPLDLRSTFDVIQSSSAHERYILLVPAGAGKVRDSETQQKIQANGY